MTPAKRFSLYNFRLDLSTWKVSCLFLDYIHRSIAWSCPNSRPYSV